MARIIVLGGCGAVGSVAVKALAQRSEFDGVTIGDINEARAREIQAEIGKDHVAVARVDVGDSASITQAITGHDLVLNCTGPFYKFVKIVLSAVIEAGIDYIDVCDDVDVTFDILDMDAAAKAKGVTAVIGCGSSPGVTNLLGKLAATQFLDETTAIDIYHAHGGEPTEGPGVIGHRFHCMSIPVPMYLDGELRYVDFFGEDGIALQEDVDFPMLGDGIRVYPYPHPEQVTLPRYLDVAQVTNKGTVLPESYYALTKGMCQLGLHSKEPIQVNGADVTPYDFAIQYILKRRDEILKEENFGTQRGCVKIVVSGKKDGKPNTYAFSLASRSEALGEGTGLPAATGALLMQQGKVQGPGVFPPEGAFDPMAFVQLVQEIMTKGERTADDFQGVQIEHTDHTGKVNLLSL